MINQKSIIFLLLLFSIALFMIGVNLGKTIEHIDKTTVLVSPTKTIPTPTAIPLIFNPFVHQECGVSFVYPDTFKTKKATDSASLVLNKDQIKMSCKKEDITDFNKKKLEASKPTEELLNNQKIEVYSINNIDTFLVTNPVLGKQILFMTSSNLTSLVLKSVDFNLK